ncbi:MAG: signal peptide peptidase SppA [Kiritimatiellales bacterium]|nr:signal peptide peptidase SppA [Kiritimatiellales bacterium]
MENRRSTVGFWIAIALLAMVLFGSFLLNIGLFAAQFAGRAPGVDGDYPVDQMPELDEVWSYGKGKVKVARIPLIGVIVRGRRERMFGYEPDLVESVLRQVRAATNDDDMRAIILEVDSPGGGVTASDDIYNALMDFKERDPDRKVVVFMRDLTASGGYYAAMAGDYLMAEPTSVVGSVGVIMQSLNMKGLGDKIGLSAVTIKSGENKDILNPFEEVDPQHVAMLQELIDDMYDRFAAIVVQSRGLADRTLLDGRIFTARGALINKMIDGIGYWDDAVKKTQELLDEGDLYVIRYYQKMSFMETLFSAKMPALPDMTMLEAPRFMYLWKP